MTLFSPSAVRTIAADDELRELSDHTSVNFTFSTVEGEHWQIRVDPGEVTLTQVESVPGSDFEVTLGQTDWKRLLKGPPEPGEQHLVAFLEPRGTGVVTGNHESFAQHLHIVRRTIEAARPNFRSQEAATPPLTDLVGRYVRLDVPSWGTCDVYYESAGEGPPLILLATAGADTRQHHGLMTDARLTSRYRLIAFDLPWHGKSSPATGARNTEYTLDSRSYTDCISTFIEGLELDEKPVLVGASMAGAVVVEMLALHPDLIAGAVGAQAGPRVANRHTPWLRSPKVNQALHVPEWTYGLMNPASPKTERDRVWWGYSQGGYGVYERDITYYSDCWDIDNVAHLFNEATPPLVLLNGVYDYSVPPEKTRELADQIPGSVYREMPELGHFPHAENPAAFATHVLWALDQINDKNAFATQLHKENP